MAQRGVSGQERFKHTGLVSHCACFPYTVWKCANQELNKNKQKLGTTFPNTLGKTLGFHIN